MLLNPYTHDPLGRWIGKEKPPFGPETQLIPDHLWNKGLAGRWLFNEAGGNTAFDLSQNNNHGVLTNGPNWTGSELGSALNFDASDDHINLPVNSTTALVNLEELTVSAWVYPTALGTAYGIYSSNKDDTSGRVVLGLNTSGGQLFSYSTVKPSSNGWKWGTIQITLDKWHHLLLRFKRNSYIEVYLDGVLDVSASSADFSSPSDQDSVYIGAYRAIIWPYAGQISEVTLYNRALNMGEIQNHFLSPFDNIWQPRAWIFADFSTTLIIQATAHTHTSENVGLTQDHNLAVDEVSHSHTSENVTLIQDHLLTILDVGHVHTSEAMSLIQDHILSVDEASHGHTSENADLCQVHFLLIVDAVTAHTSDQFALIQDHVLAIADALHNHVASACNIIIGDLNTPTGRIWTIKIEPRTRTIKAETRTYTIQ